MALHQLLDVWERFETKVMLVETCGMSEEEEEGEDTDDDDVGGKHVMLGMRWKSRW